MVRVAQYSRYDFYEFLYVDVLAGKLFFSFQFWREYAWVVVDCICMVGVDNRYVQSTSNLFELRASSTAHQPPHHHPRAHQTARQ